MIMTLDSSPVRSTSKDEALAITGGPPAVSSRLPSAPPLPEQAIDDVVTTLRTMPLANEFGGHEVSKLEREFAKRLGAKHAVSVSSGTAALYTSLVAADIGPGDEVIVTPFTFVSSVSVVAQVGATPVFADIDPQTLALDPTAVAAQITSRTRAVLPVHPFGYPAPVHELAALCRDAGAVLVGDCALAYGATVGEDRIGTIEDFGCFSFSVGKLVSSGQGGMVLTRSAAHAEALKQIRAYGMSPGEGVVRFGFNAYLAQPLAALARASLRTIDDVLAKRGERAGILRRGVEGLDVHVPGDPSYGHRVGYAVPFILPTELAPLRDAIVSALNAENVPALVPWPKPLYNLDYLRDLAPDAKCDAAEDICGRYFNVLPLSAYSIADTEAIVSGIRKVFTQLDRLAEFAAKSTATS
jgi:dTDP-4-amino-4,6-dideoxygalactose transaminase